MSGTYLLVDLGEERYALPVEDVLEVGYAPEPSPLPGSPDAVLGLQNVRGGVMPVLDLGVLLGGAASQPRAATVIVEHAGRSAALSVDAFVDVALLEEQLDRPEPAPLRWSALLDGSLVGVCDTGALLDAVNGEAHA